ncbi:MAG: response regulator [Chromatiales bacterium]|nr:response regulator [Gammaproteobacteria bacterium]MCP5351623.1 response regulator [Chromatiales bacterium]
MSDQFIRDYLQASIRARLRPLWIRLDAGHRVLAFEGKPEVYGLRGLAIGDALDERLDFLVGLEPAVLDQPFVLPLIEDGEGGGAEIHVLAHRGEIFVLFLDASEEFRARQGVQQIANEEQIRVYRQQQLLEEVERARRVAEEASQLKGRFIANMSHELRTPLSSITGYTHLLRGAIDLDTVAAHANAIERGAQHLLALIDNILDQARFEAGQLEVRAAPARLDNLRDDVATVFRPLAAEKSLGFGIDCEGDWPDKVAIDALRTRQIVINLCSNAIKFTDRGEVRVVMTWADGRLSVAVRDTGPGIPEDARTRVFEAFRREHTNADQRAGAGLGLSISARLAERMGGSLALASEPGVGTTFTLDIPAPAVAPEPVKAAGPRRSARILVTEDDADIAMLMRIFLEDAGLCVDVSENGAEAVEWAIANRPELIFMDQNLPGMNGPEAIAAMRAGGLDVPIIAMSASADGEDSRRALDAGADDFIGKPVDPSDMLARVAHYLPESST